MSQPPQFMYPNGICNENIFAYASNKIWLLTTAGMVLLMQLGMALYESGSGRRKNSGTVFYKYILMNVFGAIGFWVVGYAFGFGSASGMDFIGGHLLYGGRFWDTCNPAINEVTQYAFWCLQYAIGIISLGVAMQIVSERITMRAVRFFSLYYMLWVYPIILAWNWGTGWLFTKGYYDYAGSGVWAICGAWAGLAGTIILGPRYNRWGKYQDVYDERVVMDQEMRGIRSIPVDRIGEENVPMRPAPDVSRQITQINLARVRQRAFDDENDGFGVGNLGHLMMGGLLMFVGLFFLSAGSTWGVIKSGVPLYLFMETAAVNVILGGAGGGLVAYFLRRRLFSGFGGNGQQWRIRMEAAGAIRGFIAGIIATLAGGAIYAPWAGFVSGVIGGLFYVLVAKLFDAMHIDDPCESFAVFGAAGAVGCMVEAFFNPFNGILYGNITGGLVFGLQLMGAAVIAAWAFVLAAIAFGIMYVVRMLRVDLKTEVIGADYAEYAPDIDFGDKKLIHSHAAADKKAVPAI